MTTFNTTTRCYSPRLYSRLLLENDVEHVKRILYDWEDWPLTDEKAESLTKVWARKNTFWQAPFFEGMPQQESTTIVCLRSNDLPVYIERSSQYGTVVTNIFGATCPSHRRQGYLTEAAKLMAMAAWDLFNMSEAISAARVDTGPMMGEHHPRANKEGVIRTARNKQTMPKIRETSITREEWELFKASSQYEDWKFDYNVYQYPDYPS